MIYYITFSYLFTFGVVLNDKEITRWWVVLEIFLAPITLPIRFGYFFSYYLENYKN